MKFYVKNILHINHGICFGADLMNWRHPLTANRINGGCYWFGLSSAPFLLFFNYERKMSGFLIRVPQKADEDGHRLNANGFNIRFILSFHSSLFAVKRSLHFILKICMCTELPARLPHVITLYYKTHYFVFMFRNM